jgi:hypothetical protein
MVSAADSRLSIPIHWYRFKIYLIDYSFALCWLLITFRTILCSFVNLSIIVSCLIYISSQINNIFIHFVTNFYYGVCACVP